MPHPATLILAIQAPSQQGWGSIAAIMLPALFIIVLIGAIQDRRR